MGAHAPRHPLDGFYLHVVALKYVAGGVGVVVGDGLWRDGWVMSAGKKCFVDLAIPNSKRKKMHIVYDGERVFGNR